MGLFAERQSFCFAQTQAIGEISCILNCTDCKFYHLKNESLIVFHIHTFFCNLRFVQRKGNRGFRNHCAIETLGRVLNCVILTFLSNLFTPLSTTSSTDDRVSSQQLSQLPSPVQSQSLLYYLIRSTSISSIVKSWLMSIRVCLCVGVTVCVFALVCV